jgi:metallo-beta-lactamase family protein
MFLHNDDPFGFRNVRYTRNVAESKLLNDDPSPMVIISASGMAEAGRILHHLRNNIEDPRNAVIIVGFQAQNTLGRRLVEKNPIVKIFGEEHKVRAEVVVINSFSAHADKSELLDYVVGAGKELEQAFLVHGETSQLDAFAKAIKETRPELDVHIAVEGETVEVI